MYYSMFLYHSLDGTTVSLSSLICNCLYFASLLCLEVIIIKSESLMGEAIIPVCVQVIKDKLKANG